MPNRILRDWTDSFIVDELDVHAERFFVRLIMKVDDFGRFSADKRLLKSQLFPLKSDIRDTDISRCLTACEKAGLITIYTVASKSYLQIENFKQTLRQKTTKYPAPDECIADATHMISNSESIASLKRNETEVETEDKGIYRAFAHLSISFEEFEKLKSSDYHEDEINSILDDIENYKANKKYSSLYLTALKWLKKNKEKSTNSSKPKLSMF